MAFSAGVFSRLYDWTTDRDNNIKILADRMDGEDDGFATGLSQCMLKDGTQLLTADIPYGAFKNTGMGAGSALTDSLTLEQAQNGAMNYVASDTGAADAYAIAPSPAITAYAAGQTFRFVAANASTGASTVDVSGLGTKAIEIHGAALSGAEIGAGDVVELIYDGTRFQVISDNPLGVTLDGTETLTNKTLTAPAIAGGSIAIDDNALAIRDAGDPTKNFKVEVAGITTGTTRTWTAPDSNDTFVGKATTDVLSNKTLTAPVLNGAISGDSIANQAEMEAASSQSAIVTPGFQQHHPSSSKFWGYYDQVANTLRVSYNITGVADTAAGIFAVTIATDMSSANYSIVGGSRGQGAANTFLGFEDFLAGSFNAHAVNQAGTATDVDHNQFAGFGDL